MQLHQLKRHTTQGTKKRVGRGGKRGTYSGRGMKGQKARAGTGGRPEIRDMIKKLPKRRGYGKNRARTVHDSRTPIAGVNVSLLEKVFDAGERVSPRALVHKGVLETRGGKLPVVKILGAGELTKKLVFESVTVSAAAKKKIEAAGGTIEA